MTSLKNLSYSDRLYELNLTTLEDRRTRGDLIQILKIYSGTNLISWYRIPEPTNPNMNSGPASGIRRSAHSLRRPVTNCQQREHFLNRTIPLWNALPLSVIESNTTNQFKNRLDNHLSKQRKTDIEAATWCNPAPRLNKNKLHWIFFLKLLSSSMFFFYCIFHIELLWWFITAFF